MENLSDSQILLLAAEFTAVSDFPRLTQLAAAHKDVLTTSTLYHILYTYLSLEGDDSSDELLSVLLRHARDGYVSYSARDGALEDSHFRVVPAEEAEACLRGLHLDHYESYTHGVDSLTDFLVARVKKLESVAGLTSAALDLLSQFTSQHDLLNEWVETYVRPLHKLQNEFYPGQADDLTLEGVERLQGYQGVSTLLRSTRQAKPPAPITRDLTEIVAPWVRGRCKNKRRRLSITADAKSENMATSWKDVNSWLVNTSNEDYVLAARAVLEWDEPGMDLGDTPDDITIRKSYAQTALALLYTGGDDDDDDTRLTTKQRLLCRAADLSKLFPPNFELIQPDIPQATELKTVSRGHLASNMLLEPTNPLTNPSTDLIDFLHGVLATQQLLSTWRLESSTLAVLTTILFDPEEKLKIELQRILKQLLALTGRELNWQDVRLQLMWLQSWQSYSHPNDAQKAVAYFGGLQKTHVEEAILDAMLTTNDFHAVRTIYIQSENTPLSQEVVLTHIFKAIYDAYDNASNGNRTRGGVKRASLIASAFAPNFPNITGFSQIEHLIKATHNLSFYQLTLQHGIPFQPVNIRVSQNALSLLTRVLEQNAKAYTRLDDLISIARDLVLARVPASGTPANSFDEEMTLEERLADAEHRVTFAAITAALRDHDFDTAYSLITSRFNLSSYMTNDESDDITWRAVFAAGQYETLTSSAPLHERITALRKRMDLLSQAMGLAPAKEVPVVLEVWERCELALTILKRGALEADRALDQSQSASTVPGGFGMESQDIDAAETQKMQNRRSVIESSYEGEAPVGLFDVARGAASALRKTAFPLRTASGGLRDVNVADQSPSSASGSRLSTDEDRPASPASMSGSQRLRKRDMLSSAVTGTVVSGLGWVLGAQPVNREGQGSV